MNYLKHYYRRLLHPIPRSNITSVPYVPPRSHDVLYPRPPARSKTFAFRKREFTNTGKVRRCATITRKLSQRSARTIAEELLQRRKTIREDRRKLRRLQKTIQQLESRIQPGNLNTVGSNVTQYEPVPVTAQFHESLADVMDELSQRLVETSTINDQINTNLAEQQDDEIQLLEIAKRSGERPLLSDATVEALMAVTTKQATVKKHERVLTKLSSHLDGIKEQFRQARYRAGLWHYERDEQDGKRHIMDTQTSMSTAASSLMSSLNAFYSSIAKDLFEYNLIADEMEQAPVGPEPVEQEVQKSREGIETKYDKATHRLTTRWKEHDWYQDQHSVKLLEKIDNVLSHVQADLEHRAEEVRSAAAVDYFKSWQEQIQKLREAEDVFIKRRKEAVKERVRERAVNSEFVDAPAYPETCPSDGQTESMSPKAMELRRRRFLEKSPLVEDWIRRIYSEKLLSPELQRIEWTSNDVTSNSIAPWDSLSSAERLPRRKLRINDYQRDCLEWDL